MADFPLVIAGGAEFRWTADVDTLRSGLTAVFVFFALIAVEIKSGTWDLEGVFLILPESTYKYNSELD